MGKPTFDLVASFYPLLEQTVFGSTLSRARNFFISQVTQGNNILLIGEGNGRFLFEMVKQTSSASITVVDSSARMLAAAARRLATVDHCSRIQFIHADISEWRSPVAHYDRVVTHFFLDLFTPFCLRRVVEKISRLATEYSLWINVDFSPRILSPHESMRPYIRQVGWEILERRSLDSGWIFAHLMSRLTSVQC